MPTLFYRDGMRFFFYANEGVPLEPIHVHFERGDGEAKVWLHPEVRLAYARRMRPADVRKGLRIAAQERVLIERKWHEFFS